MREFARWSRSVVALPGVLVLVGACTGEGKTPPAAPTPSTPSGTKQAEARAPAAALAAMPTSRDACKLLSKEIVKAATGVDGEGQRSESGGADVCTWSVSDASKSVVLQLYPFVARYEESREAFESLQRSKSEDLSGLGEKAFYVGGKLSIMEIASISALKGSTAISVQVMGTDASAPAIKTEATALTKQVLERL